MKLKSIIRLIIILSVAAIFLSDGYFNPLNGFCPSTNEPSGSQLRNPTPTPVVPRATGSLRPAPGTGLEPLIFNPPNPNPMMPWEIWWIRNRLNYLSFREPIVWEEKKQSDDGGTVAVGQGNKELLESIARVLKEDKNQNVRAMAALALGKFKDKKAIPFLKEALKDDKDFDVKNVSCLSLGILQDTSLVNDIKEILLSDAARDISRAYAALSLGYIKDNASVEPLKKVFAPGQKTPKDIVCAALISLGNLWSPPSAEGGQDKSLIPFLGDILNDVKRENQVRAYAALALGKIKDAEVLPILRKALQDKNADIRANVAIALGLLKSTETKNDLVNLVTKDKDPKVRQFAAISLGQLGDKSVSDILLPIVTGKKDYELQGFAVIALGLLGEEKALDILREIVVKKNKPLVRTAAVIGLGLLKDKKSVPDLINILEKEELVDPVAWVYTIQALGMIGDAKAIPPLEKIYQRAQKEIALANNAYNNLTVALAMLGKKKEVLEILHKNLKDKSAPLQILLRAIHGIAYVGDKSSVEVLLSFNKDEKNGDLRIYAMFALGFVLDRDKINPLYKITADNNYNIWLNILDHIYASKPD